jgi:hypothetical protein
MVPPLPNLQRCIRFWATATECPARSAAKRNETKKGVGIDGRSLGNGTAFSAVAPSQQPVCETRRSNTREWYCPQARIAGHLTFRPLVLFRPECGFSYVA